MKPETLIKDGVQYWTMKGLALHLGVTVAKVRYYRKRGAIKRVALPEGVYYHLDEKYELEYSYQVKLVIKEEYNRECYRLREVVRKRGADFWLKKFTAQEMMIIEGISYEELIYRRNAGVYQLKKEKYCFLTDKEWNDLVRRKGKVLQERGWMNAKHGKEWVFKEDYGLADFNDRAL